EPRGHRALHEPRPHSVGRPAVLVKTLQQTHPSYDGASLRRLRALYEGGPTWRAIAAEEWFPQRFAEPVDVYEERKKLLTYVNHAGSLVEMVGALLFAEAPQLEGVPSPPVPEPPDEQ